MSFRAFLDASILVPARWRDIILTLAECELFAPLWSERCLGEVERHLPESMTDHDRKFLFQMMNEAFPDALVKFPKGLEISLDYEGINNKDRHIVAAALFGGAELILTNDKPLVDELARARLIDAQMMPEFLAYTIDADPRRAVAALTAMARNRWRVAPGSTDEEIVARLQAYFAKQGWGPLVQ